MRWWFIDFLLLTIQLVVLNYINQVKPKTTTNLLSWISIVLAHWNNSPRLDIPLQLGNIILIPRQPVFVHSS
jgi:hypothetical protein